MVKAEQLRRKNKKSENRVADVLSNNKTPIECTAKVEYKIAAKRQCKADTHKFSDAQMPVRCVAHQASEIQGELSEPDDQRDLPEDTVSENSSNIEHHGSCGNGCDGDARNTKLRAKVGPISSLTRVGIFSELALQLTLFSLIKGYPGILRTISQHLSKALRSHSFRPNTYNQLQFLTQYHSKTCLPAPNHSVHRRWQKAHYLYKRLTL